MEQAVRLAAALQVYNQKEQQKTLVRESRVSALLEKTGLRSGSFDSMFPTMFSLHGLDIQDALKDAVARKDITKAAADNAIIGINNAIRAIGTNPEYLVLTAEVFSKMEHHLQNFSDILFISASANDNEITKQAIADMKIELERIKSLFKRPYIVSYYEGSNDRVASVKILHNSFSNLRTIVNNKIKSEVDAILKSKGITNSKISDRNYLTQYIINWGHTRTEGDSFLSGKLVASLMSLMPVSSGLKADEVQAAFSAITKDFLQETGQEKIEIKLHTGDLTRGNAAVLQLVLSSQFVQKVKVQDRYYNQVILGQAEKSWSLLDAIGRKNLLGVFKVNSITELASKLLNTRSSPSTVEKLGQLFKSAISGEKISIPEKTVPLLNKSNSKKIPKKIITISKKQAKMRLGRALSMPDLAPSLVSLQNLLNANLVEKIKQNMGDGTRRDILNLRSGRFAESVKVERLSESRQGMITAFYTYMKNPYATFAEGGRQQSPASRNPKLLISKSIREIAQQQVANRLRAVSI